MAIQDDDSFQPSQYWEERLKANWGLGGVGYLGLGRYNHWVYRAKRMVFNRTARSLQLPQGFRALDIGCGTGFFIDRWLELGAAEIVGVDLTETSVSQLQLRYPGLRFVQRDISKQGDDLEGGFNVVSAMDVLFHIVDQAGYQTALQNIHRLLKPDGYFVFSEFFLHGKPVGAKHHMSRMLRDIEAAVEAAGFSVVRRIPMHVLMNQPLDTRGSLALRVWDRFTDIIERHEWFGMLAGATLFPVEAMLIRILRESPSTELMICRARQTRTETGAGI